MNMKLTGKKKSLTVWCPSEKEQNELKEEDYVNFYHENVSVLINRWHTSILTQKAPSVTGQFFIPESIPLIFIRSTIKRG